MTTICPDCSSAVPVGVACEQCALEAALVASVEGYLHLAAEFEAFCAERDARLAAEPVDPEPDACHGAVCLYPHGCPGGCRFHDVYAPPPRPKAPPC